MQSPGQIFSTMVWLLTTQAIPNLQQEVGTLMFFSPGPGLITVLYLHTCQDCSTWMVIMPQHCSSICVRSHDEVTTLSVLGSYFLRFNTSWAFMFSCTWCLKMYAITPPITSTVSSSTEMAV